MNFDNLAILDVETTGASAPYDRIIEIGVIRIEKNKIVKKFETLINPEVTISPFIENLTGIVGRQLKDAPLFSEIKSDLAELLDGCVFVAHNARFDYSFIRNEYKRIGVPYSAKQLCTVKLSRLLFPNFSHHNLDSIIERFEIKCERRHRALDDAMVLWDFLQKVGNTTTPGKLQKAFDAILKKPSLPPLLKSKDVEALPERAGVYLFFGKSEIPLYIGKSINIKDRVLSHFINDVDSSTELEISQQIERIETIETGGELSALLLESELVKKLQPIYNRKLRNARRMVTLRQHVTKDGYNTLSIVNGEEIKSEEVEQVLGIFKSVKSAKEHLARLVEEYQLCQKMLGLQKVSGPCFAYHLEKCKGACLGKENPILFNARFVMAFAKTKLRAWPFSGPILVKERRDDVGDAMVFDKWCYLGKFDEYEGSQANDLVALSDFDVYKILQGFLRDEKNLKKITTLPSSSIQQIL
jgi:DNA polymerase-3 subunit epsilon